jgi:large subunit ribosomal protein L10
VSLNPAQKNQRVEAIRERFSRATSAVLVDFKGLDVESATELRVQFRKAGVEYKVVKNTLVKLALKGTKLESNQKLQGYLVGPTGVAWCYEDPSAAAKIIKSFREDEKRAEKLTVKCGVLETAVISGERVESELATMPGKDEARAMLLAQLQAPAQSLLRQLTAAGQNLAFALDARKRQLENKV